MCEQNIFKNCNILTYFSNLLFSYFLMKYISNLIPFYLFYKKILLYILCLSRIVIEIYFPIKNDTFHFILKNFSPHRRRNKRKDYITGGDLQSTQLCYSGLISKSIARNRISGISFQDLISWSNLDRLVFREG